MTKWALERRLRSSEYNRIKVREVIVSTITLTCVGARGTVVVDSRQLIKVFQVPELSNRAFIGKLALLHVQWSNTDTKGYVTIAVWPSMLV